MTVAKCFYRRHRTVGVYVTRTGTVPQIADRIEGVRVFPLLVRSRLEVIGVAPCAVRLICGETPGSALAVTRMTAQTGQVGSVVARIIGR